jgi:hypothetical protein
MAASPVFTSTAHVEVTAISTANTNRDGTGTIATVFTAGASGSRVDRIIVHATSTTTAGAVRLFLYDGTNYRLFKEVDIDAVTPAASTEAENVTVNLHNFNIPGTSGFNRIAASTHNAEAFNVIVMGSDL